MDLNVVVNGDNFNYVDNYIININDNLVLSFHCNIEISDTESYDTRQITPLPLRI